MSLKLRDHAVQRQNVLCDDLFTQKPIYDKNYFLKTERSNDLKSCESIKWLPGKVCSSNAHLPLTPIYDFGTKLLGNWGMLLLR